MILSVWLYPFNSQFLRCSFVERTGTYEGEMLERARHYLPDGADYVLDVSELGGTRYAARIEQRLIALLTPVYL